MVQGNDAIDLSKRFVFDSASSYCVSSHKENPALLLNSMCMMMIFLMCMSMMMCLGSCLTDTLEDAFQQFHLTRHTV
jgi:hypothetical protein